jgi:hypothetical protein
VVAVDEETGRVVAQTPITQMKAASRDLREAHDPEPSKQFHDFMAANNQEIQGCGHHRATSQSDTGN